MQQKPFLDNFKLRNKAYGNERRLNMTKLILDHAPNFPLSVELKDIDSCVKEWVENELDISFDGKKIPTFRLFSNQRINEYAQTWNHLDETGNLLLNFKTITRDNNPKKGQNQGESYNIPGNRDYPMFMVPVLQENGRQAYDMYSMKQPYSVDLDYSISIVTNKYELINEMNQLMNDKFKAIDCYIFPNQHPMPLVLEDIADESEYSIDDRKYYSQTYKVKLKAYIIREEDYKVTRLASRVEQYFFGDKTKRKPYAKLDVDNTYMCQEEPLGRYYPKTMVLNVNFPICENMINFVFDAEMDIDEIELTNVREFAVWINNEPIENEDLYHIYNKDDVHVEILRDDDSQSAMVSFIGHNSSEVFDRYDEAESVIDEKVDSEIIDVNIR